MAVPNIFATATSSIPLSQLDTNFATAITLGSTALYLGNTTTSVAGLTLTGSAFNGTVGVTTASTGAFTTVTATGGVDKLTSATGVVSVAAATAPTTGQVLMATSGTVATWQTLAASGKILQVIQSYIAGKASTSSTSRTILATSASITPSSASSKILFALYTAIGNDGATGNADFDIIRTVGATNTSVSTDFNKQGATAAYQNDLFSYSVLDSPATTSAVTYSIRGFRSDGVAVPFVGGRATDTAYAIGVMFILQEVAA